MPLDVEADQMKIIQLGKSLTEEGGVQSKVPSKTHLNSNHLHRCILADMSRLHKSMVWSGGLKVDSW